MNMLAEYNTPNNKKLVLPPELDNCLVCAEPLHITRENTGCGDPDYFEEFAECPNGCTLVDADSHIL